jgi:phosphoribosylaminoimidazole-succinocarboxamide synthase
MASEPMRESNVRGYPRRQGKVRDVYDLGDRLVIVATDRISAFDWVLPSPIPDKGRVLTSLTRFWLRWLNVPNHLLSVESKDFPPEFRGPEFAGRTMLVRKTAVVPVECVVRGYLAGSGWKDYRRSGAVCGVALTAGLRECEALREPIFTPATKAETGHDENISFDQMVSAVGRETAAELRAKSLDVYRRAVEYAGGRGVIIADTKFEWGRLPAGELILIDEVLTPDSSRFWPGDGYRPGQAQPSFDK